MGKLLLVTLAGIVGAAVPLAVQACADASAAPTAASASTARPIEPTYEDFARGVVCYEAGVYSSLSCVKVR